MSERTREIGGLVDLEPWGACRLTGTVTRHSGGPREQSDVWVVGFDLYRQSEDGVTPGERLTPTLDHATAEWCMTRLTEMWWEG